MPAKLVPQVYKVPQGQQARRATPAKSAQLALPVRQVLRVQQVHKVLPAMMARVSLFLARRLYGRQKIRRALAIFGLPGQQRFKIYPPAPLPAMVFYGPALRGQILVKYAARRALKASRVFKVFKVFLGQLVPPVSA